MTGSDDLRDVIRRILPAYATDVIKVMARARFNGNYFRGEGSDRPDFAASPKLSVWKPKDGITRYSYHPRLASGMAETRAVVEFKNIRVVGIDSVEIGDPDVSPAGDGRRVGLRIVNDSPEEVPIRRRAESEKERETEQETERGSESTFAKTVNDEFRAQATASASGGWGGISVGLELETELTKQTEVTSSKTSTWRHSDRRTETLRRTMEQEIDTVIRPFHSFSITAEESIQDIRQSITVVGILQANLTIRTTNAAIDLDSWYTMSELEKALQGLHAETPLAQHFANNYDVALTEDELATWERPTVRLELKINGERTRMQDMRILQRPIRDEAGEPVEDDEPVDWSDI